MIFRTFDNEYLENSKTPTTMSLKCCHIIFYNTFIFKTYFKGLYVFFYMNTHFCHTQHYTFKLIYFSRLYILTNN